MLTIRLGLLGAVLAGTCAIGAANAQYSTYRVTVTPRLDELRVAATLPVGTRTLVMDGQDARHLPRGWATFTRVVEARDSRGAIAVTPADSAAEWQFGRETTGPVHVTYVVDLGFTRKPWPPGNEQAGASFDDAVYLVGKPVFLVGDGGGAAEIQFDAPVDWRVSSPLPLLSANRFRAENPTQLRRNAFLIGKHTSAVVKQGPFELELALPGETGTALPVVQPLLEKVTAAYLRLFPETPPGRFLMTFFRAAADDGESFLNSASFTTADPVRPNGMLVWGNFLAHELMHYWNGQRIHGAPPRTDWRWLAEGFTEYYANVTLARVGAISDEEFLKKADRHLGNYLYFATAPHLERRSLVQAGANTTANRFGVYDGGWTVAFCLDGLIREKSATTRSLDDFMHQLWVGFGSQAVPGYTVANLDQILGELVGEPRNDITQLVESTRAVDVKECAARFGFDLPTKGYAAEAFLVPASDATPEQRARFAALIRPSPR